MNFSFISAQNICSASQVLAPLSSANQNRVVENQIGDTNFPVMYGRCCNCCCSWFDGSRAIRTVMRQTNGDKRYRVV